MTLSLLFLCSQIEVMRWRACKTMSGSGRSSCLLLVSNRPLLTPWPQWLPHTILSFPLCTKSPVSNSITKSVSATVPGVPTWVRGEIASSAWRPTRCAWVPPSTWAWSQQLTKNPKPHFYLFFSFIFHRFFLKHIPYIWQKICFFNPKLFELMLLP